MANDASPTARPAQALAEWDPEQITAYLREIGEAELADELAAGPAQDDDDGDDGDVPFGLLSFEPKPWQHTAHSFGYVALADGPEQDLPVTAASMIEGDATLVGAAVKLTLDRLHVADYPGRGTHSVALEFEGQSQAADRTEPVQFAYATQVRSGTGGAVGGWPVFVGMQVGPEGLAFRCRTINVKSSTDEQIMSVLQSRLLKQGLGLAKTAQPVLVPFVAMVSGLTTGLLENRRNVVVQDFDLGLDFSRVATRARLREGSYIAVQVAESPERPWVWSDWIWSRDAGRLVNRADPTTPTPYNYLVFSISRS